VVPLARRRLRSLVGHLVLPADEPALTRVLAARRRPGQRLNLNLLGEAVLGEAEAARRAGRIRELLTRPDVDHVSVKVSALVAQPSRWDSHDSAARAAERLRPILLAAAERAPAAFVTLDMEEYRDLDLTLETFEMVLAEPELARFEAGIAVQAYLPDSLGAFERLLAYARSRRSAGGARLKVRLVKGANLAVERAEAELHGWTPAPFATKAEVDASYVRLLDLALRAPVTEALRIGVASHNLYDVALAHLLARARGVDEALDVEMLHGMAPAQADAVRREVGSLVLYTPVVSDREFEVAVSYLVRRLEENAGGENFLHALLGSGTGGERGLADQEARFVRSVADLGAVSREPRRRPVGGEPSAGDAGRVGEREGFRNVPDADPALSVTRELARRALAEPPAPATSPVLDTLEAVDRVVARAAELSAEWVGAGSRARADVLRSAADRLEGRRTALWSAMAHEGGKTIGEADPEVSEAVDLAAYYADCALALDDVDGARFLPAKVTVVTPPWNFPVGIPLGSAMAALAAGSAVVLKPAPQTPGCAEIAGGAVREALAAHGFHPDVLQVVRAEEDEVGRRLVTHPTVDALLLTGSIDTARLFRTWRPHLRLMAETSGKNAIVVTPAADPDLAVADVVRSAFGHAGQKCSAASLVILVGSAAESARVRRQLVDAVASVRVGWGHDPATGMGPLIERPQGKLLHALTRLDAGESWLVEPRRLDGSGRLWSPGLKEGVQPGSFFHLTECFGPVLGLMTARSLEEAVRLQNGTPFGLTGGLHSLDEEEIAYWLAHVEVGNAYVNRHVTGAIVRRQPFGGWKTSSVGPGAKAGGPNYVAQVGQWVPDGEPTRHAEPSAPVLHLLAALEPLLGGPGEQEDRAWVRSAAGSDAYAWQSELGVERDVTGLAVESNVQRYRPVPVLWVRAGVEARWAEVVRVRLAAELAGTPVRVSLDPALVARLPEGRPVSVALRSLDLHAAVESEEEFVAALEDRAATPGAGPLRVRVLGDADRVTVAAAEADVTVLSGPALASGRRELLTVVREQAVSRTLHRFGHLPRAHPAPPA
jgi:RHH-type proline utilization regulon transcriptional repressor/proline dehydrogenase/delta 1-pyrroline-5-carboxylate dehydrogenase